MKKLSIIYIIAALLNWLWENLHARLYVHYQGGEITQWILFRSAFFVDATIITMIAILFIKRAYFRERIWWVLVLGLIPAIIMEKFALATGRWLYGPSMPVLWVIHTGLTPTIQLGVTACIAYLLAGIGRFFPSRPQNKKM